MITTTWSITNLNSFVSDGKVYSVDYLVTGSDEQNNTATCSGIVELTGDVEIPYNQLTENIIIDWIKSNLGQNQIDQISAYLENLIIEQVNPTKASGVPW